MLKGEKISPRISLILILWCSLNYKKSRSTTWLELVTLVECEASYLTYSEGVVNYKLLLYYLQLQSFVSLTFNLTDRKTESGYARYVHTTKAGIVCTLREYIHTGHTASSPFFKESETIVKICTKYKKIKIHVVMVMLDS